MTNKQIIEQCSERFYTSSNAALAEAEGLEESVMCLDAEGQAALDRATELRYSGMRDAIVAYALVGDEAPADVVGAEAARDVHAAMRTIIIVEWERVGQLDTLIRFSSRQPLQLTAWSFVSDDVEHINAGRFLEELRREATGSGADAVIRAAKRADLPYEPPTTTTQG